LHQKYTILEIIPRRSNFLQKLFSNGGQVDDNLYKHSLTSRRSELIAERKEKDPTFGKQNEMTDLKELLILLLGSAPYFNFEM